MMMTIMTTWTFRMLVHLDMSSLKVEVKVHDHEGKCSFFATDALYEATYTL